MAKTKAKGEQHTEDKRIFYFESSMTNDFISNLCFFLMSQGEEGYDGIDECFQINFLKS
jgi:hypothetical protein